MTKILALSERFDDWIRQRDFKAGRVRDPGEPLSLHNWDPLLWAGVVAAAMWTGVPTGWIHALAGVGMGAFFCLVWYSITPRLTAPEHLLYVQVGSLSLFGAILWLTGSDQAQVDGLYYRHLLIPIVAIVAVVLLATALLARVFFRPLIETFYQAKGKDRNYADALGQTELFQSRGSRSALFGGSYIQAIIAIMRRPLLLLFPASICALAARPSWLWEVTLAVFSTTVVARGMCGLNERLEQTLDHLSLLVFRGAALGLSIVIILLAAARLKNISYVSTIFDAAPGPSILLYLLFLYGITGWYDSWNGRLIGQQLLRLFDPTATNAVSVKYLYSGPAATAVPASNRRLQIHTIGRFIAYRPADDTLNEHRFHFWTYRDLFNELAAAGAPGGKSCPPSRQVNQRIDQVLAASALLVILGIGGAGWWLHQADQQPELTISTTERSTLKLSELLRKHANDPSIVLVAASGGGTRAAIFTATVLEGLRRRSSKDIVLGSGVSGGGMALGYYANRRERLVKDASGAAWDDYFGLMSEPYIQDVIERSAEWRMVGGGRLGTLLAESLERRWARDEGATPTDGRLFLHQIGDLGLILNSTLAGRESGGSSNPGEYARSDVAGGRLILTNLVLAKDFGQSKLGLAGEGLTPVVLNHRKIPVAFAAALASNFPPVFSNAGIAVDGGRYWVTDGGAADNSGLEMLLLALREALKELDVSALPPIHVVVVDAGSLNDRYEQDRGFGSATGAGAQYAAQLNHEVWTDIQHAYAGKGNRIQIHYVPMPEFLRREAFGTHWMLQPTIKVRGQGRVMGTIIRDGLRAAYGCAKWDENRALVADIQKSDDFTKGWCSLMKALSAQACGCS